MLEVVVRTYVSSSNLLREEREVVACLYCMSACTEKKKMRTKEFFKVVKEGLTRAVMNLNT